jgi:hypothetical protein
LDDATLTKLICSLLGAIPGWDWHEPESDDDEYAYAENVVGIFYGALDPAPDTAVGVRVYGSTDDLLEHYGWRRVQLRHRGAKGQPGGADDLAALSLGALQGLSRTGGISGISRQSMAPAGADANRREERTDNYIITLDNLEALDG